MRLRAEDTSGDSVCPTQPAACLMAKPAADRQPAKALTGGSVALRCGRDGSLDPGELVEYWAGGGV
jgi:hypothetical protein